MEAKCPLHVTMEKKKRKFINRFAQVLTLETAMTIGLNRDTHHRHSDTNVSIETIHFLFE